MNIRMAGDAEGELRADQSQRDAEGEMRAGLTIHRLPRMATSAEK
jgi:hypothetical protein